MIVHSALYGALEIGDDNKITLVHGMPGFESLFQYAIVPIDEEGPFCILQSLEQPDISFVLTCPYHFFPDYEFQLPEPVQEELEIEKADDVQVWVIMSIQNHIQNATVNLMAPLVVNRNNRTGKQVILNESGYHFRHRLLPEPSAVPDAEG